MPDVPDVRGIGVAERPSVRTPLIDTATRRAAAQHGVVAGRQLREDGVSREAIKRAARGGLLVRKHRDVFAVGHDRLTIQGHWMAAVLAGGEGTVLSHRSAGAARGLRPDGRSAIDITVPGHRGCAQSGLTPHRCALAPEDVTEVDGIPITTVARTLLDLAEVVPYHHLRRAVERAEELRLFDLRAIEATMGRATGRRGVKPLRAALEELVGRPEGSRREMEALALDLIRAEGLPTPVVNTLVGIHEVDLLWRERRLVVELDSWGYHRSRRAFVRDRRRDADLLVAGYRVLRLTWGQVADEPAWVAGRLRELLATGGAARPS